MDLYDDYLYKVVDEFDPDHNFMFVKIWEECRRAPNLFGYIKVAKILEKALN